MRKTISGAVRPSSTLKNSTSTYIAAHRPHPLQRLLIRQISRDSFDKETLGPCSDDYRARPMFLRSKALHGNLRWVPSDPRQREFVRTAKDSWMQDCAPRLNGTGLAVVADGTLTTRKIDRVIINVEDEVYFGARALRLACKDSFAYNFYPYLEIEARKLCAETKDPRYPIIYRSLERQAHSLYIIGRIELEREPAWHPLAAFILTIAAGLGQLDAALLLHQLGKYDPQLALRPEQRSILAEAAETQVDWRAMYAHAEYLITRARGRAGPEKIPKSDLDQCLKLLQDAMALTTPATQSSAPPPSPKTIRSADGRLAVDELEIFPPPYKLLLDVTAAELRAGNESKEVRALYETASRVGAFTYHDPEAAWHFANSLPPTATTTTTDKESSTNNRTAEWVQCAELAATDGNADACLALALHRLRRDGWLPSATAAVLAEHHTTALDDDRRTEQADRLLHDEIMARKRPHLLQTHPEALDWLKIAAGLNLDRVTRMVNRYCVVAGVLRQNGFLDEGRAVLVEARERLTTDCVDRSADAVKRATKLLDEYLEFWDRRLVHQLLDPESIDRLIASFQ